MQVKYQFSLKKINIVYQWGANCYKFVSLGYKLPKLKTQGVNCNSIISLGYTNTKKPYP